jgi:cation transport ATPase
MNFCSIKGRFSTKKGWSPAFISLAAKQRRPTYGRNSKALVQRQESEVLRAPPHRGELDLYFEAAAVITVLVLLGQWLEARARGQTGRAIQKVADQCT